jgi:predicted urease superfamily metal-dependent hydrolase
MKQTAVEWLAEQLPIYGYNVVTVYPELIEQAKEMFEQQIIDASNESYLNSELIKRSVKNKKVFSIGEQYYNETFS